MLQFCNLISESMCTFSSNFSLDISISIQSTLSSGELKSSTYLRAVGPQDHNRGNSLLFLPSVSVTKMTFQFSWPQKAIPFWILHTTCPFMKLEISKNNGGDYWHWISRAGWGYWYSRNTINVTKRKCVTREIWNPGYITSMVKHFLVFLFSLKRWWWFLSFPNWQKSEWVNAYMQTPQITNLNSMQAPQHKWLHLS